VSTGVEAMLDRMEAHASRKLREIGLENRLHPSAEGDRQLDELVEDLKAYQRDCTGPTCAGPTCAGPTCTGPTCKW